LRAVAAVVLGKVLLEALEVALPALPEATVLTRVEEEERKALAVHPLPKRGKHWKAATVELQVTQAAEVPEAEAIGVEVPVLEQTPDRQAAAVPATTTPS
jgi:hypothetical protein